MPAGITRAQILTGSRALNESEGQEFMRLVLFDADGQPFNLVGGQTGPQGLQGLQGQNGPQGVKGDKGDKGDRGDVGPSGLKGDRGDAGPQGLKGDKGDTGLKGDVGEPGPPGLKGDKGDTGFTGGVGLTGAKGDTGSIGPQGVKGDKGDTGATGESGALIGSPMPWLVAAIPNGYLEFNGQAITQALYPVLFGLFGGNLPDLRDKFLMGASATEPVGVEGGLAAVTLAAAQSGLPAHTHDMPVAGGGLVLNKFAAGAANTAVYASGGVSGGAKNATASHENRPPFRAVKWITKAG